MGSQHPNEKHEANIPKLVTGHFTKSLAEGKRTVAQPAEIVP